MATFDIAVAVFERVEELDFVGPYEVLAAWARFSERSITVRTVGDGAVRCAHGLQVTPEVTWAELGRPDLLVMPGGGVGEVAADQSYLARLNAFAEGGSLMTSVCNGAIIYAAAGLLSGRRATTHWSAVESLKAYPDIEVDEQARFVDEGTVVTAAGISAGIDMALHLVARFESVEMAQQVRRYLQYDPQPPV